MEEEKIFYFSQAEFSILLELAGGGECSLLSDGTALEDDALAMAFTSLFQRGLIQRDGDGFALAGAGRMFAGIRNAAWAISILSPSLGRALCYAAEKALWLVELADVIVAAQYRVQQLDRGSLRQWLFDSGILESPMLTEEDLSELSALSSEEAAPISGRLLLRLEKYRNGGPLLEVYEVRKDRGRQWICGSTENVNYTQEALSRMLADCFGKGAYDCC